MSLSFFLSSPSPSLSLCMPQFRLFLSLLPLSPPPPLPPMALLNPYVHKQMLTKKMTYLLISNCWSWKRKKNQYWFILQNTFLKYIFLLRINQLSIPTQKWAIAPWLSDRSFMVDPLIRVLLYASSQGQDNTYHSPCYASRGALAGTRNSPMGPPWRIDPMTHHTIKKERERHRERNRGERRER